MLTPGYLTASCCVEKLFTCPLQKKFRLAATVMELLPGASCSHPSAELAVTLAQVSDISPVLSHGVGGMPITISASACQELQRPV